MPASIEAPRLQAAPLLRRLLGTLIVPFVVALLIDWWLGTAPWVMLIVAVTTIPLASIVVGRAVLRDFQRVVDLVAPEIPVSPADMDETVLNTVQPVVDDAQAVQAVSEKS